MPYIPPEVVEQARQIDLLTYLQSCEPQELVRISGNNYTTRTHRFLTASGCGGHSASAATMPLTIL